MRREPPSGFDRGVDRGVRRLSEVALGVPHAKPCKGTVWGGWESRQSSSNARVVFLEMHNLLYVEKPVKVSLR